MSTCHILIEISAPRVSPNKLIKLSYDYERRSRKWKDSERTVSTSLSPKSPQGTQSFLIHRNFD